MASVSLAEPRRRQKWTMNPRGNLWANDENKFGHKLMEKMGWEKGKGLGAKQTGMVTHVKIKQKDNQKGIGFEGHDDTWLAHQDDFQAVLAALNVEHGAAGEGLTEGEKKASLEAISRKSKRRVHYQKFVKGKDSSNYSADDLGCILGTNSEKVGAKAKAVVEDATKEQVEENNGKFTQATGSYQDYFAAKMAALKAKGKYSEVPDWTDDKSNPQTIGLGAAGGRAVDREVERDSLLFPDYLREAREKNALKEVHQEQEGSLDTKTVGDEDVYEASTVAKDENLNNEEIQAEPFVKKKKSKDKSLTNEEIPIEATVDDITEEISKKKKKSKKNKHKDNLEDVSETVEVLEDISMEKQKKKKHKKNKHEDVVEENTDSVKESLNDSFEEKLKKKKTKKSKKEKVDDKDKETIVEDSGCEDMEVKAKKVKKSKKEKSKESSNSSLADKVIHPQEAEQSSKRKADNDESEEAVEEPPKKKKKSKKKAKDMEEEEVLDAEEENVSVLSKDYKEAPGGFKGSNLMAIPGYGNVKK